MTQKVSTNDNCVARVLCCRGGCEQKNVIKSGSDPASDVLMKADLWSASLSAFTQRGVGVAQSARAPRDDSVLVSAAEPSLAGPSRGEVRHRGWGGGHAAGSCECASLTH